MSKRQATVPHNMVTTTFELQGYHVVKNLGVVRGIVVRSRSVVGTIGASLQTLVGGDISLFTQLCEDTRNDAFERMLVHAAEVGKSLFDDAGAIISLRMIRLDEYTARAFLADFFFHAFTQFRAASCDHYIRTFFCEEQCRGFSNS